MNEMTLETRQRLGTDEKPEQKEKRRKIHLLSPYPPNDFAPLICRVVRAVRAVRVLGAGLGFPVGGTFGFTPPTSDH